MALSARLESLVDFLLLIERYKTIERRLWMSGADRRESDAEHSWHLAMFVWLLAPEVDQTLDQSKLLKLVLMHDLVEIYCGDVSSYDTEGRVGKKEREETAANQLFGQLPSDFYEEFMHLFREFEDGQSPEAKLAQMFDKLQPIFQNVATQGRGWQEEHLTYNRVDSHKRPLLVHDPVVEDLYHRMMERARDLGLFFEDKVS